MIEFRVTYLFDGNCFNSFFVSWRSVLVLSTENFPIRFLDLADYRRGFFRSTRAFDNVSLIATSRRFTSSPYSQTVALVMKKELDKPDRSFHVS